MPVRSADGTAIHAEIFGSDELPTLVLGHGWTEALRYWALVMRELSGEFRIVAYDLRGHGHSAPAVDNDYSLQRFGEDLEACSPPRCRRESARSSPVTPSGA